MAKLSCIIEFAYYVYEARHNQTINNINNCSNIVSYNHHHNNTQATKDPLQLQNQWVH